MSLDLEILDILNDCNYPRSSYRTFGGLTRAGLGRLPFEDLVSLLRHKLPANLGLNRNSLVVEFMAALVTPEEGQCQSVSQSVPCIPTEAAHSTSPPVGLTRYVHFNFPAMSGNKEKTGSFETDKKPPQGLSTPGESPHLVDKRKAATPVEKIFQTPLPQVVVETPKLDDKGCKTRRILTAHRHLCQ